MWLARTVDVARRQLVGLQLQTGYPTAGVRRGVIWVEVAPLNATSRAVVS
jgi:hypothetical protein